MGSSARIPVGGQSGRHRGLFLVPKDAAVDTSRGEASDAVISIDSLAHAYRIVAQVEHEIEVQAARERVMRLQVPVVMAAVPQATTLWSRATSFFRF